MTSHRHYSTQVFFITLLVRWEARRRISRTVNRSDRLITTVENEYPERDLNPHVQWTSDFESDASANSAIRA